MNGDIHAGLAQNHLLKWVLRTVMKNFTASYGCFQIREDEFVSDNLASYDMLLEALDGQAAREAATQHILIGTRPLQEYGKVWHQPIQDKQKT